MAEHTARLSMCEVDLQHNQGNFQTIIALILGALSWVISLVCIWLCIYIILFSMVRPLTYTQNIITNNRDAVPFLSIILCPAICLILSCVGLSLVYYVKRKCRSFPRIITRLSKIFSILGIAFGILAIPISLLLIMASAMILN